MTALEEDPSSSSSAAATCSQKARKRYVVNNSNNKIATGDAKQRSLLKKKQSQSARIRQKMISTNKQKKIEERRIAKLTVQSQSPLQKLYFALVLNAIALAFGAVLYLKPELFLKRKVSSANQPQWPPHHLAILYPPKISPREDLPLLFQQYAIATDQNKPARAAVQKLMNVRELLKPFQIFVTGWERQRMLDKYPLDDYCGTGFQQTYKQAMNKGSIRHAEDLLHWCLLYTYQNDGFMQWNMTLERSPISRARQVQYSDEDTMKGIVAKHVGHDRIHPSILWLPKKREQNEASSTNGNKKIVSHFDMNSQLPAKMLLWLIQTAPNINVRDYPVAVEEQMYQLVMEEKERWMIFDAICDHYNNGGDADLEEETTRQQQQELEELQSQFKDRGVMARDCLHGQACCVTYLPKVEPSFRTKKLRKIYGEDYSSSDED